MMQWRYFGTRVVAAIMLLVGASAAAFGEAVAAPQAGGVQSDFTVVSAAKDSSHPHYGDGSPVAFVVDGVQGRSLVLIRGKTYAFHVDTGAMHDFYLSTDPRGWGVGTVTVGVEGNFTYKGIVKFTPTAETPDVIYYQCRNHKYMGGTIHVVNPGEEDKVTIADPTVSPAPGKTMDRPELIKYEVKQRLDFVDLFISQSESAKCIAASNNDDAKAKYRGAEDRLATAKSAFDSGDLQATKVNFEAALALMKEAVQKVPSQSMQEQAKTRYEKVVQGVMALEESYRHNSETIVREEGTKNLPELDSDKIHKMLNSAKALSESGKYDEADTALSGAMNEVSAALNKLLAHRTISYVMKFASQAEEYEYELARFRNFEKLIPLAKEKLQPPQEIMSMAESHVLAAKAKREQANVDAGQKSFAAALENIEEGTEQLKTALAVLGVK